MNTEENASSARFGFIAAQIAVASPLLAVGEWAFHAVQNCFAYTHPADFETWDSIFHPADQASITLIGNGLFMLQLVFSWFIAFIWHQYHASTNKQKPYAWTMVGTLGLIALFPGIFLMAVSHGPNPAGIFFLCLSLLGCHLQSCLTLSYFHQSRQGSTAPHLIKSIPLCLCAVLPLAVMLYLKVGDYHPSYVAQIEKVLNSGAAVDVRTRDGNTMLHAATFDGQPEAVTLLLKRRADINARNNNGATPFSRSLPRSYSYDYRIGEHAERYACVSLLIKAGADPYATKGEDPLLRLCKLSAFADSSAPSYQLLRVLLESASKLNVRSATENGTTALHYAARNQWYDLVPLLVQRGASPYTKERDGKTPLQIAQENKDKEMVRLLTKSVTLPKDATP